jgi:hypothetical protein
MQINERPKQNVSSRSIMIGFLCVLPLLVVLDCGLLVYRLLSSSLSYRSAILGSLSLLNPHCLIRNPRSVIRSVVRFVILLPASIIRDLYLIINLLDYSYTNFLVLLRIFRTSLSPTLRYYARLQIPTFAPIIPWSPLHIRSPTLLDARIRSPSTGNLRESQRLGYRGVG